ncbi:hypothetical protein D3C77_212880 [compost metagenome]
MLGLFTGGDTGLLVVWRDAADATAVWLVRGSGRGAGADLTIAGWLFTGSGLAAGGTGFGSTGAFSGAGAGAAA